jgi:hypothetical protein
MKLANDCAIVSDLWREMVCKRHENILVGLSIPLGQNARRHLECAARLVVEVEGEVVERGREKTGFEEKAVQESAVAKGISLGVQLADHGLAVCGVGMIVVVHDPEESLIGLHVPGLGLSSHDAVVLRFG